VQAFGGADFCGVGDTGADSANDIIGFSSRGPTSDGRKKPDIMLPGTHISGTVAQASNVSPVSGTGAQLACFTADGVCGGVGINFFPAGQQWYTASSGTSHSTPAISGFAALLRQDFINRGFSPPSPAMTKALMMNTAAYMNGTGANDTLPSNNQEWAAQIWTTTSIFSIKREY
jgi:subtilisin family serine protease